MKRSSIKKEDSVVKKMIWQLAKIRGDSQYDVTQAKDSHLLLLPMTICANTAAKDVNKRTAQVCFVCWYDGPQERVLLIGTNNGLYCSFLRSILVLLVVTYGTTVSFAAAYDEYVLLSAKCQENCEFDWLLGAREFAQILDIPCEGACVFTDKWSLDELANGVPTDGPYQTNPPSPDDIISYIRIDREGQVCRIRHEEEIDVHEYQILTREIVPTLKPLEEIIRENSFELSNDSYVLYDRVMNPLTAHQERKTRKDRGTRRGRHSTSSSSAFDQPSSSHLNDDDDGNGEGTSRASTPSPIRFVNSLTNNVPQVFQNPPNIDPHMEPFYTRQTEIINRQVQI
ncbi:hypothetical protein Tco_1437933 [Tanacetum coccineum]